MIGKVYNAASKGLGRKHGRNKNLANQLFVFHLVIHEGMKAIIQF